nr:hypothetical protein [Cupriavidus necator]
MHRGKEHRRVDRLGDMVAHAGGQAALAVLGQGVGGHRDHRQAGQARLGADAARGLEAVHARHLHVHQRQVVGLHRQALQRLHAALRRIGRDAGLLQQVYRDLAVDLVVFHQQHAPLRQRPAGPGRGARRLVGPRRIRIGRQHAQRRIEQHRRAHRLEQRGVEAAALALAHHRLTAVGGHHQRPRARAAQRQAGQPARGLDAVQPRHAPVDKCGVIGIALRIGLGDGGQRGLARRRFVHAETEAAQHRGNDLARIAVVVHDQQPAARQFRPHQQRGRALAAGQQ